MLGAIVDCPDLGIKSGRIIMLTQKLGGYIHYRVSFNPKEDEVNPSSVAVHQDEVSLVNNDKVRELGEPEFDLGDAVLIKEPLGVEGVVGGIVHSISGCVEYEVYYKTSEGIVTHTLPGPLLEKIGVAAEMGTQKGSMNRSVERRS